MDLKKMAVDLDLELEEFYDLVEVFVETTASDLAKLESAISTGAAQQAVEAAHSIKGAAGSLGLMDTQGLAKEIEMNARQNLLEGSLENADAIKKELHTISDILTESRIDEAD